ncbi:hypothetical protein [Lactococcus garvieae]|uniref:hypothetical protein n=1 Tax=Lactococcus garvieae TaxID=1363 RepID=UPI0038535D7D
MPEIKVTFSDGSSVVFHEDQAFGTWIKSKDSVSQSEIYTLWYHHSYGLSPSMFEILLNSEFFYDIENPETNYNSNSVVKVQTI